MASSASPRTHSRDGRRQCSDLDLSLLDTGGVRSGQRGGDPGLDHLPLIIVESQVREGGVDVPPESAETRRIDELTPANLGEAADHSLPYLAANVLALEQGGVQHTLVRRPWRATTADRLALPPDKHERSPG